MTDPIAKAKTRSCNPALAVSTAERYAKDLRRFLFRRLGGPQDVDDLAQEVYLRCLRVNPEMQVHKPLALVFTIAARVLADHRAEAAKRAHVAYSDEAVNEMSETVSEALSERIGARADVHERIEEALSQLPPKQAALLLMIKRDGISHADAAAKLGINAHTIHYHVQAAMAKLRRLRWEKASELTDERKKGE